MAVSVRVIVPSLRKKNAKRVNDKPIKPERKAGRGKEPAQYGPKSYEAASFQALSV